MKHPYAWFLLGALATTSCGAERKTSAAPTSVAATPAADAESFRSEIPKPGPASAVQYPTPEQYRLENGLSVWLLDRPAPTVSLAAVVRHEGSEWAKTKSGLAALTARMLSEGTERHPGQRLAEAVEGLGTELQIDTSRDATTVSLEALSADLDRALSLLAEVTLRPQLSTDTFERVRREWSDGVRQEREDPRTLAALLGMEAVFGSTHGAPVKGRLPDLERLTLADLRAFHQQHYAPAQSAIVVVGPLGSSVRPSIERLFGAAPPRTAPKPVPLARATSSGLLLLADRPSAPQTAIFALSSAPPRSSEGYELRELTVTAFGGLFTSRLNQNLREKHAYTYGAFSYHIASAALGAVAITTSVRTPVTKEALEQIMLELKEASAPASIRPFTEAEIGRAKADLTFSLTEHLEHTNRIATDLAQLFVNRLDEAYFSQFLVNLAGLGPEMVQQQAQSLLDPARFVVVLVGDRAQIEGPLRSLGYEVRLVEPTPR